jgi:hypothetical protein
MMRAPRRTNSLHPPEALLITPGATNKRSY